MSAISLPELDAMFRVVSQAPLSGGAKPRKHRGAPVNRNFPKNSLRWRRTHYVTNRSGLRVCWLWTTTRNVDGYFVGCREVYDPKLRRGFRDDYRQRKSRWRVKDWALAQFNNSPHRKQPWTYPLKKDKMKPAR